MKKKAKTRRRPVVRGPQEQLGPALVRKNPMLSLRMQPEQMGQIERVAAAEGMTRETWARAQLLKASRAGAL